MADKKILLKPTRYCATRSPKSFEEDFFFPYSLSKYIKVFSTPALEKTRYCAKAEPNAGGEVTEERSDVWKLHIVNSKA